MNDTKDSQREYDPAPRQSYSDVLLLDNSKLRTKPTRTCVLVAGTTICSKY